MKIKNIILKTARAIGVFIAASYFVINVGILAFNIAQFAKEMIKYYN